MHSEEGGNSLRRPPSRHPRAQRFQLLAGNGGPGCPPVLDPRDHAPVNPTTISIRLQAGFPLGEVKSHFHNVRIDSPDSSTRVVTLGAVPADRDFELTWTAAAEKTPSVGLFREQAPATTISLPM